MTPDLLLGGEGGRGLLRSHTCSVKVAYFSAQQIQQEKSVTLSQFKNKIGTHREISDSRNEAQKQKQRVLFLVSEPGAWLVHWVFISRLRDNYTQWGGSGGLRRTGRRCLRPEGLMVWGQRRKGQVGGGMEVRRNEWE